MVQEVCVFVTVEERVQLRAIVADRHRPLKHVHRARIILASAGHLPVLAAAHEAEVRRPAVWRCQRQTVVFAVPVALMIALVRRHPQ